LVADSSRVIAGYQCPPSQH